MGNGNFEPIENAVIQIEKQYAHIEISNQSDYESAGLVLKQIKSRINMVLDFFKDTKEKAYLTWKSVVSKEKLFTDKLHALEKRIKSEMGRFYNEQEARRRVAQRRLQEEENRKAEEEQKRLLKKSMEARIEGKAEKAEEIDKEMEVIIPEVVEFKKPEKVEGIITRKTWCVDSVDKKKFIVAACKDDNLLQFISINIPALNKIAAESKGKFYISGVTFKEKTTIAVRK